MKRFWSEKTELKPLWRVWIYLGLSLFILFFCVALQAGSMTNTLRNFLHEPALIALNLFPILAVLGLLAVLTGNLFWAGSFAALIFHLLSLANLIKIECRRDPLVPPDFGLLSEAMVATGEYRLDLHIPYLIAILLVSAAFFLLGVKFKTHGKLRTRIATAVVMIGLFVGSMLTVYPSPAVYTRMIASVEGLSISNVPAVFDETGFLYCFLHNYKLYEVQMPEGYDATLAAGWAAETAAPPQPLPVDVVFIQCEAFSDIFDADAFDYAPGDHPLALFHQVAASSQAISGRIVVSNYGAGTANTEFDVMTGIQTNMLNEISTSAFRVVHKHMSSLARTFGSAGYDRWFMHPGQPWFYNRESVYDHLGIQDQTFLGDFAGYQWKGAYISDESFGKMLRTRYEAQKNASEAPWFAFTVTIQNHQAYPWSRYQVRPPEAPFKHSVSDEALEALSVYAEGIRDSSKLLYDMTAYFDTREQPLLLIFWGDHLPALGKNYRVYQEIGLDIGNEASISSAIDTYSTPFLIWANRAYCNQYDFLARAASLDLPAGNRISDIYLGELVYELCGLSGADAYWDFLGQARRTLPVICQGRYELPDGTMTEVLTAEQQAVESKLRKWGYYRVMDERTAQTSE